MESPDSPYAPTSSEAHPKRSSRSKSPGPDDKDGSYIRFLISNTEAGCIIGKGGSTITEFQSESGARIQLSRNHEFFPGTSDRIIMISGSFENIIKAMELINEKLLTELVQNEENGDASSQRKESDIENRFKVRLVVPNGCCGGIIGKGGATIKQFIEDSHAGIKISPQDHSYAGLNDRIVTLTGSSKEQMRALYLILSKLIEDSHYSQSVNTPYPYGGVNFSGFVGAPVGYMIQSVPYHVNYGGPNGTGGRYPNNKGVPSKPRGGAQEGQGISVTIGVADEHIGAVVGRAGRNIMEISQTSGARIKISDRGDFMTGTSDRKVTITGTQEAIRNAEKLIMQKIAMNSES